MRLRCNSEHAGLAKYDLFLEMLKYFFFFPVSFLLLIFLNFFSFFMVFFSVLDLVVSVLLAVAFMTLVERKIMGGAQRRTGPNVVGFAGLLQPIADGLKLVLKELVLPIVSNKFLLVLAPMVFFLLSLLIWAVMPFFESVIFSDLGLGVFYVFAISSLGVYGVIIAGWASNSRYAFLGCLRSAAQMIAYEVSIGLIVICVCLNTESLSLIDVVEGQNRMFNVIGMFPLFLMFFVSALAETNRPPFDLPEAEAELVSGYNVEYSSVGFALFFIGEYANILFMCGLTVSLFFGGWLSPFPDVFPVVGSSSIFWFLLKLNLVFSLFVLVRVALPRFRYDQLMSLGWKVFLPLTLGLVIVHAGILVFLDYCTSF